MQTLDKIKFNNKVKQNMSTYTYLLCHLIFWIVRTRHSFSCVNFEIVMMTSHDSVILISLFTQENKFH